MGHLLKAASRERYLARFSQQKEPVSTANGMIWERLSDDKRIAVEDESRALTESVFCLFFLHNVPLFANV
jgi:hypothetical protein